MTWSTIVENMLKKIIFYSHMGLKLRLGVDGLENCRDLKVKSSIAEVTVNVGSYY